MLKRASQRAVANQQQLRVDLLHRTNQKFEALVIDHASNRQQQRPWITVVDGLYGGLVDAPEVIEVDAEGNHVASAAEAREIGRCFEVVGRGRDDRAAPAEKPAL